MKLIKPKFEIIDQEPELEGIYKAIELAGRTCYKSTGTRYFKIPLSGSKMPDVWSYVHENIACYTKVEGDGVHSQILNGYVSIADKDVKRFEGLDKYECEFNLKYHKNITAKDFTERMIKSGHLAMLEFGTVYLKYDLSAVYKDDTEVYLGSYFADFYKNNKYSKITLNNTILYVTTNYRVIIENCKLDDLAYLCEPTEFHEKRVCVRFTTSIGISRELNRHRVDSISEQSTRYCNFSKDKFGNELTFIIPSDSKLNEGTYECFEDSDSIEGFSATCLETDEELSVDNTSLLDLHFLKSCDNTQYEYLELIKCEAKPQQARNVLTLGLATEVNHCAFISDWKHFFKLRDDKAAHPDMINLAKPLHEEFIAREFIK